MLLAAGLPDFLPHINTAQSVRNNLYTKPYRFCVVVQRSGHARRSASASILILHFNEITSWRIYRDLDIGHLSFNPFGRLLSWTPYGLPLRSIYKQNRNLLIIHRGGSQEPPRVNLTRFQEQVESNKNRRQENSSRGDHASRRSILTVSTEISGQSISYLSTKQ